MRALFERSRPTRAAIVVLAIGIVAALVHAASAGDDLGLRRDTLWPEVQPAVLTVSVPSPVRHRHARRIWAASHSRPLRVALARRHHRTRVVAARLAPKRVTVARVGPAADQQVVFPKLLVLPKPPRPALVSIYQDRTLRDGDAVMMADGIHVFHGLGEWPHAPRDFVRLQFVAALGWHLRRTLDVFDQNPPTRWSSVDSSAG